MQNNTFFASPRLFLVNLVGQKSRLLVASTALLCSSIAPAQNVAMSPIFGYDPTIGAIVGAALFFYPSKNFSSDSQGPPQGEHFQQVMMAVADGPTGYVNYLSQHSDWQPQWDLEFTTSVNNFDQLEFNSNAADARFVRLDQQQASAAVEFSYHLSEQWRWGLGSLADWQQFTNGSSRSLTKVGLSTGIKRDSRDDRFSPTQGSLFTVNYQHYSDHLASGDNHTSSNVIRADARAFVPLFDSVVHASRLQLNWLNGSLEDFSLGGDSVLRGYVSNRFTADRYALLQQEVRFPIWGYVRGVAFAEAATIHHKDDWYNPYTYGAGLRFGLPPDGKMSVRLDIAQNDEGESNLYVNFNHIF